MRREIAFSLYGLVILVCEAVQSGLGAAATYDQRQTGDLNVQVHVKDLKVVALVDSELLEDYTDYDYFYDYADFTIKPITKPTTPSSSVEPWYTWPTNPPSSGTTNKDSSNNPSASLSSTTSGPSSISSNEDKVIETENTTVSSSDANPSAEILSSVAISSTTNEPMNLPASSNTSATSVKSRINDKMNLFGKEDVNVTINDAETVAKSSTTPKPVQGQRVRKRCRSGYSPDGKGRCRWLNRRRVSLIPFGVRLTPQLLENRKQNSKDIV